MDSPVTSCWSAKPRMTFPSTLLTDSFFVINHDKWPRRMCWRSALDSAQSSQSIKCQQRAARTHSDEVATKEIIAYKELPVSMIVRILNRLTLSYPDSSDIRISLDFLWPLRLVTVPECWYTEVHLNYSLHSVYGGHSSAPTWIIFWEMAKSKPRQE
jgi:hypothetical protein